MQTMTGRLLSAVFPVALALTAACGRVEESASPAAQAGDGSAPPAAEDHVAVAASGEAELLDHGETVFDQVCTVCHTLQPPPKLAPPMMGISGHYHDAFTDRDEAVVWMVAYIQSPDSTKSKLSPEAFQRFGTMAPLPLPEEDLRAVMTWVWEMYDPDQDPRPAWERTGDGGP